MTLHKKGSPVLSQVAQSVKHGADVSSLILTMRQCLQEHKGAGLAANQVGSLQRVISINTSDYVGVIINPVITSKSNKKVTTREGCLSFPNELKVMMRTKKIIIEGFDENWMPISKKLKFFSAAVAQHEVDHLNGITIAPNK